ncbi:CHC2 zinc finger domain-containing protein, partial [Brevundimonas sp.]|uniref:CHC2 zinc finger domain-containing protein n=1 Tax=Brevundimonas sp. TaxID=1871086 RepID=UPI0025B7C9C4
MGQQAPKLTCRQARAIDLIGFLGGMGITPVKVRGDNFWYLSPLRNERHASFKISKRLNRWYDFGLGKGGNILDFGLLYFACSIPELLDLLGQN